MEKKKSQWETIKSVLKYTKKYNIYMITSNFEFVKVFS